MTTFSSSRPSFDTVYLGRDELKVVMAADHPMASADRFPIRALGEYPFMTIDKQGDSDIAAMLDKFGIQIQSSMTTWDDYAVFAMVEKGLGISVQPSLILQRLPFNIVAKSFEEPQYRELALAMRNRNTVPLATRRFIDYLGYRNDE